MKITKYCLISVLILSTLFGSFGNFASAESKSESDNGLFCIPIGEDYDNAGRIANNQLGPLIDELQGINTVVGANSVVLSFISAAAPVSGPISAMSWVTTSAVNSQSNMYAEAYYSGHDLYYLVKRNPDYNGYNAFHVMDWFTSSAPICGI